MRISKSQDDRPRWSRRLTFGLVAFAFASVWSHRSIAQVPPAFQGRFAPPEAVLMAPPREVESLLGDAQEAIDGKQWTEATVALGQVLGIEGSENEPDAGEDYFIPKANRQPSGPKSILAQARAMMESLPEEAKQTVELRYGVRASQLLSDALAKNDIDSIYNLSSRYGFTQAGRDATLLLANHLLADGNPTEASVLLDRLLKSGAARERYGAALGVLALATKLAVTDRIEGKKYLDEVRGFFPNASVEWDGNKFGWNEKTSSESIIDALAKGEIDRITKQIKTPFFEGGSPDRNGNTAGGKPIPILRWSVDLHESSQHNENLEKTLRKQMLERRSHVIPTRTAVSANDLVFIPTYDQRILAIDAKTGKIRWPIVFSGSPLGASSLQSGRQEALAYSFGHPSPDYLIKRVWGDFATSSISTDGSRLFSISDNTAVEVGESFALGPNARTNRNLMARTNNVLQAWSIPEEGKLLWECGALLNSSAPELKGALFLGSPLPVRGELLVLAELNGEVYLVSLAPKSGKLNWRQPLAANQGTTISLDPQRKLYGASPTLDGSLVLCPTISGFLIAFDMNRKELAWSKNYPLNTSLAPGAAFNIVGGMDFRESDPMASRPLDTSVIVHDGVTVFAPSNGNAIYGISNKDGSELWQIPIEESSSFRYVAGAWNKVVALAYSQQIVGVDLQTGQPAWPAIPMPNNAQIVGKGVRSDSKLLVPLSNQQLVEIDLVQGSIVSSTHAERPLGNLVVVGNKLLSTSPYELASYSIRDSFQQELVEELKKTPGTASTFLKEGELALAAGNIEESLSKLNQARTLAPEDRTIRRSLMQAIMQALQSDFEKYIDRVEAYQVLTSESDLPTYLRLAIHGLEKQGRWEEALIKLLELSDTRMHRRIDRATEGQEIEFGSRWSVQEDCWISSHLARVAEKIPKDAWPRVRPKIEERLQPNGSNGPGQLRLRLQHFEGLPYTIQGRLDYAKMAGSRSLVDAESVLQAGKVLGLEGEAAGLAEKIQDAMASLYLRGDRPTFALRELNNDAERFLKLVKQLPQRNQPGLPKIGDYQIWLERFRSNESANALKHSWPSGKVVVNNRFFENPAGGGNLNPIAEGQVTNELSNPCTISEVIGHSFEGSQAYFQNGELCIIQSSTNERIRFQLEIDRFERQPSPRLHAIDSLVLLELKDQLIAIDLFGANMSQQDGQLWSAKFGKENSEQLVNGRSKPNVMERNTWGIPLQKRDFRVVGVSRSSVIVQADDELFSLHPLLGTRQWVIQGFRNASLIKKGDSIYAFIDSDQTIVKIDSRDGKQLERIPVEFKGWTPLVNIGERWLFQNAKTAGADTEKKTRLRLIEPTTGEVILNSEHTPDTRLALAGNVGVVALRPDGTMFYWNVAKGTESQHAVDVEGKFSSLSAQVFGDLALILPYAASMELEGIKVAPDVRQDPTVAPCAGRIFAISLEDGKQVWNQSRRIRHFFFPISQNRNSPAAIFIRRLTLSNVKGMTLDQTSIALVDVKTGKTLYENNELPAIRNDPFFQRLYPQQDAMEIKFQGNLFSIQWTDQAWDSPADPDSKDSGSKDSETIADLDKEKFQTNAEARVEKLRANGLAPENPGNQPPR